jgi:hypothetical protein
VARVVAQTERELREVPFAAAAGLEGLRGLLDRELRRLMGA